MEEVSEEGGNGFSNSGGLGSGAGSLTVVGSDEGLLTSVKVSEEGVGGTVGST